MVLMICCHAFRNAAGTSAPQAGTFRNWIHCTSRDERLLPGDNGGFLTSDCTIWEGGICDGIISQEQRAHQTA